MFDIKVFEGLSVEERYENMINALSGLLSFDESSLTNLCNAEALINALLFDVSWCGFYILKGGELVLGPFQGMPACTRIKIGKGVCGTAAEKRETVIVYDVNKFKGHIACDAASNSEIVVPIIKDGVLCAVLDVDSTSIGRFTELEKKYLERAVEIINKFIDWNVMQNI